MATKLVTVCDWHDEDVTAIHHNDWVNLKGEPKENDLCDEHQEVFLKAWEAVERGSTLSTRSTETSAGRSTSKKAPKGTPSDNTLARAWARSLDMDVNKSGRVGFHIERAWRQAGRPNVLAGNERST